VAKAKSSKKTATQPAKKATLSKVAKISKATKKSVVKAKTNQVAKTVKNLKSKIAAKVIKVSKSAAQAKTGKAKAAIKVTKAAKATILKKTGKAIKAVTKLVKKTKIATNKASSAKKSVKTEKLGVTNKKLNLNLNTTITPLDDRVLVQVLPKATRTAGGLYISDSMTENENTEGLVIAVGRGHQDKKGRMRQMDVKIGQKILFAKYSGSQVKMGEADMVFIRENEILGVID
jgi:chaperonin GroES